MASRNPRGTQPRAGHASKGSSAVPSGSHTRANNMWAADPERLTSDAPHSGAGHPPRGGGLPPPPERTTPDRKSACTGASAGTPMPTPTVPKLTGNGSWMPRLPPGMGGRERDSA